MKIITFIPLWVQANIYHNSCRFESCTIHTLNHKKMSIKERIKHTTQLIALNEAMIKAAKERLKSIDTQLNLKK